MNNWFFWGYGPHTLLCLNNIAIQFERIGVVICLRDGNIVVFQGVLERNLSILGIDYGVELEEFYRSTWIWVAGLIALES